MKTFLKLAMASAIALTLTTTVASADAAKGQKLYAKKLKAPCGMSGADFAKKNTVDGWGKVGAAGMAAEIKKICPSVGDKAIKEKYMQHYLDFATQVASDSGNVPSC